MLILNKRIAGVCIIVLALGLGIVFHTAVDPAFAEGVDIEIKYNFEKETGIAWIDATQNQKDKFIQIFRLRKAKEAREEQRAAAKAMRDQMARDRELRKQKRSEWQRERQKQKALLAEQKADLEREKRLQKSVKEMRRDIAESKKKRRD